MSKEVTREEMLAKLRELPCPCKFYPKMDCPQEAEEKCTDINDTLRALILDYDRLGKLCEKVGEWKKKLNNYCRYPQDFSAISEVTQDIRDFEEEGK